MSGEGRGALPIWRGGWGVIGAAAAVVAVGLWYVLARDTGAPTPTRAPVGALEDTQAEGTLRSVLPEPMPEPVPEPAPEPVPEQADAATPEPAPDQTASASAALPDPRLDAFRLEPDGLAVIAGRAVPGDTLLLRIDGSEIARTDAGADGAFAAVAFITPSEAPRVLTLAALGADGTERLSPDEFIIAPMAQPSPAQARADDPVPDTTPQTGAAPAAPDVVADGAAEPAEGASADARLATASRDPAPDASGASEQSARAMSEAATPETNRAETNAPGTNATETNATGTTPAEASPSGAQGAATVVAASTPPSQTQQTAPDADTSVASTTPAARGAPAPSAPLTDLPSATAPTPTPVPSANQVAILRSTPQGVEVIQPPGPPPETLTQVALDAISYSAEGDVQLSGRAERNASEVRVYLDNRPIATLTVDPAGTWRGDVSGIASGVYTLRVDAVDRAGDVQSRLETPFKREAPELLAAAVATSGSDGVKAITVQQGATLWAIARERYGDPFLYVQVFEANRGQIRDPDLIYPGQVFTLPDDVD